MGQYIYIHLLTFLKCKIPYVFVEDQRTTTKSKKSLYRCICHIGHLIFININSIRRYQGSGKVAVQSSDAQITEVAQHNFILSRRCGGTEFKRLAL